MGSARQSQLLLVMMGCILKINESHVISKFKWLVIHTVKACHLSEEIVPYKDVIKID
jgi:hypothetical protein